MTNQEIDDRLIELGAEISALEKDFSTAAREYESAKARYENELDRVYLTKKAETDATVRELEALANTATFELKLQAVEKEAVYRETKNRIDNLDRKIGILQSIIKLRTSEMRTIGG